jgi:hypothetical protein
MAKNCSRCGKRLSFRDSFVWEKKPVCGVCLKGLEQGQKWEGISEPIEPELSTEGMTGGEWLGAIFCTPYGLIKYFDWKKTSPRKAKQVCTFYLIAYPIAILIRILIEMG